MKGLKNVTVLAESATSTPAVAPAEPIQTGAAVSARTAGPAPITAATPTQPAVEAFPDSGSGDVDAARVEQEALGQGEQLEQEQQPEAATVIVPPQMASIKPKARGELLLDLIRSFRGGMLRVDSNLRGTMFRSLRYLVSVFVSILYRSQCMTPNVAVRQRLF